MLRSLRAAKDSLSKCCATSLEARLRQVAPLDAAAGRQAWLAFKHSSIMNMMSADIFQCAWAPAVGGSSR